MRTYLQAQIGDDQRLNMVLSCSECDKQKPLSEMYGGSAPSTIQNINTHRLIEFIGKFNMDHADCKKA